MSFENKPEHLEDLSTKEKIKLVQGDSVRRWGQIIISFVFVGSMIGYLGWYTITQADSSFQEELAQEMKVLAIMGVGAALAIFGLGRTVGRKA